MQAVLRLPPCVRQHVFQDLRQIRPVIQSRISLQLQLRNASTKGKKATKRSNPPNIEKPTPSSQAASNLSSSKAQPQSPSPTTISPKAPAQSPAKSSQPSPPASERPPKPTTKTSITPPPVKSTPTTHATPPPRPAYSDELFRHGPSVLLYAAPRHTSFFLVSYISGALFLLGAINWTVIMSIPPPPPANTDPANPPLKQSKLLAAYTSTIAVVLSGIATVFILAPIRLIKTITAIKGAAGQAPRLRFQIRRAFPVGKPQIFEESAADIYVDRRFYAMVGALPGYECTLDYATKAASKASTLVPPARKTSLWASFSQDITRMFTRRDMAYVRLAGLGNFKLDMHGCLMADRGDPLVKLLQRDYDSGVGVVAWVRRKLYAATS